ncbi:uncharacterized protein LOC144584179 [Pogona vitticeps]
MLSMCLILLWFGMYTTSPIERNNILKIAIKETQAYNENTMQLMKADTAKPQVDLPVDLTKECAKNNLKIFWNSLKHIDFGNNSELSNNGTNLVESLGVVIESWPEPEGQGCTTSKGTSKELLEDLAHFLRELSHYLNIGAKP